MIQRFELFTTAITQIYKSLQKIKNIEMVDFGLKGTHVMCLFYLQKEEHGLTNAQLCSLCEEDKAAISRTISELSEKGYITISPSKTGKNYRAPVLLTDSGQEVANKINQVIINAVSTGGAGLSNEERSIFYHSLLTISENLKLYSKEKGE